MMYDKAIIKLLLQRARSEFYKGTNAQAALEIARLMAENNQLTGNSATAISQKQ
ncbi:hypothetical protein AB1J06_02215 [Agrobacterium tumefaciens]|uniref:hypothetical protein n=1 Tax=Agrobacterium tumefaciens TaxID=358 RepID=UPI0013AF3526